MPDRKRSRALNKPFFMMIDKLELYSSMLIKHKDLPKSIAESRFGATYNRTQKHRIRALAVEDGIVIVRVE